MNRSSANALLIMGTLVVLAGCETTGRSELDANFGNAYRNMVASQIHDPEAASRPPVDPPMTMDGQRGSEVIEAYRAGGEKKGQTPPALSIKLGK